MWTIAPPATACKLRLLEPPPADRPCGPSPGCRRRWPPRPGPRAGAGAGGRAIGVDRDADLPHVAYEGATDRSRRAAARGSVVEVPAKDGSTLIGAHRLLDRRVGRGRRSRSSCSSRRSPVRCCARAIHRRPMARWSGSAPEEAEGHDTTGRRGSTRSWPTRNATTTPRRRDDDAADPTSTTALPGTTLEAANEGDGARAAPWRDRRRHRRACSVADRWPDPQAACRRRTRRAHVGMPRVDTRPVQPTTPCARVRSRGSRRCRQTEAWEAGQAVVDDGPGDRAPVGQDRCSRGGEPGPGLGLAASVEHRRASARARSFALADRTNVVEWGPRHHRWRSRP